METTAPRTPEGRSLMGLFSDLWRETSSLIHQEVALARAELSEKISHLSSGAAAMAVGGAIVFSGFLVLLGAAVGALWLMLDTEHRVWLAPLIVGLSVVVLGFIILAMGRKELRSTNLSPSLTIESMRRDAELVKGHIR
jgi:hypothetical protein